MQENKQYIQRKISKCLESIGFDIMDKDYDGMMIYRRFDIDVIVDVIKK